MEQEFDYINEYPKKTIPDLEVNSITTCQVGNNWDAASMLKNAPVRVVAMQDRCGIVYCVETLDSAFIGMAVKTTPEDLEDGVEGNLVCKASVRIINPASSEERRAACRMFGFDTAAYYRQEEKEKEEFLEAIAYYFGATAEKEFKESFMKNALCLSQDTLISLKNGREKFMAIVEKFGVLKDILSAEELGSKYSSVTV